MNYNPDDLFSEYSAVYKLEQLVGRDKEKTAICNAIKEGKKIVYLEAGIGKTRFLQEFDTRKYMLGRIQNLRESLKIPPVLVPMLRVTAIKLRNQFPLEGARGVRC